MSKPNYKSTIVASCLGYVAQATVNNFAPLLFLIFNDSFGIPLEKITILITLNFIIQLTVDLVSAKLIDRIGYRISVVFSQLISAAGLIAMATLPFMFPDPYVGLLISVLIYAVGGGLSEVLISPIVEACPFENKHGIMSLLHSFYCWGTVAVIVISTVALGIFGSGCWPVLSCVWAILPLFNALLFTRVPIETLCKSGESMPLRELFSTGLFWSFLVLMFAAGASEMAMNQWASAFAEAGLGISKTAGDLAGPCVFSLLMGTARLINSKARIKTDLLTLMIGCGVLCAGSYLLAAFAPHPALALVGLGVCGFSVGILWPGVYSAAGQRCPRGGTAMFAMLALAGDLGCSAGPTLVGMLAGTSGDSLSIGMASAAVFPLILIVCAVICKREGNKGSEHISLSDK